MRTSGHALRLVMLRRTSACLKLGRRCLSTVALCHREIITHRAKYIFKMTVVRFLMARCEIRSMGGKVNGGVVNVCSCSRYKPCVSHILAIRFVIEAFIRVSLNCRGVWIQRQLLKRIYIPEIHLYTELSDKISYLLRPVFFLINPEGNNNYTNSYRLLLLLYKTAYITAYSLCKSFINTQHTLSWLWPTSLSCGGL